MPKINEKKCYKHITKPQLPIAENLDAGACANAFISLWSTIKGSTDDEAKLRTELQKHIGADATSPQTPLLISSLNYINDVLSDRTLLRLSKEKKQLTLFQLQEQISTCTSGLLNRVQNIIHEALNKPMSVDALLLRIRNQIVDEFTRRTFAKTGIHTHNYIFQIAQRNGFNVTIPEEHDPHVTEVHVNDVDIAIKLKTEFEQAYDSFDLLNRLIDTIKEALSLCDYNGQQSEVGYKEGVYRELKSYFDAIFETNYDSNRLFVIKYDPEDNPILITDINWLNVAHDLMDYLVSKGYFLESPTEQAFLKAVLTNQAIEFSSDFFYTHLTKTTGVLSFFKFTKDIDTRTQLSLLNSLYSYFSTNEPDEKRYYYPLCLTSALLALDNPKLTSSLQQTSKITELFATGVNTFPDRLERCLRGRELNYHSILTMIGWMEQDEQIKIFNHIFSDGNNLLLGITKYSSLKKAFELLQKFPPQSQKQILEYKGPLRHQNILSSSVIQFGKQQRDDVLMDQILSLHIQHELLSDDVLIETFPSGDNILLWSMQVVPKHTLTILKCLSKKSPQIQEAVLLKHNTEKHNCLSLALKQDVPILDAVISLISDQNPSSIYCILNQATRGETNILIEVLNYPTEQQERILQLFEKLPLSYQYALLLLPTNLMGNANILHFATRFPLDRFNHLLDIIFKFDDIHIRLLLQSKSSSSEKAKERDVLLECSLSNSEHMAVLIKRLASEKPALLDLLLPQFSQLVKNTAKHSLNAFTSLLNCLSYFPEAKQGQLYCDLSKALGSKGINDFQAEIISKDCFEKLSKSNANSEIISDILIQVAKCSSSVVNACIKSLTSEQVQSIYQKNIYMIFRSVVGNYFETLLSTFSQHLSREQLAFCVYDPSSNFSLLTRALRESPEKINAIFSLPEDFLVTILMRPYQKQTLFFYVMNGFPLSDTLIGHCLNFKDVNKMQLLSHPNTLSEILECRNSQNRELFQEVIKLRLLDRFEIQRKDLQYGITNLSNPLFNELLSLPNIKKILFKAGDKSLIFDMIEQIPPQEKAGIYHNISQLLDKIRTLGCTQEEITSLLNVDNWCTLCCADLDDKIPLLTKFLGLIDCNQTKIKLFTSKPEHATDDDDNKIDSVFSRAIDLPGNIIPILELFLTLKPQSGDILKVFSLTHLYWYKHEHEEKQLYERMTVFLKCLDTRNLEECQYIFNMIRTKLTDAELESLLNINILEFFILLTEKPILLQEVCEFFKQHKVLLSSLMTGHLIENIYEIMEESSTKKGLGLFFDLMGILPEDTLYPLCLASDDSPPNYLSKQYNIEYNLLETMLSFEENQSLVINLLKSKSKPFIYSMIKDIAVELAYQNPQAIFQEVLGLLKHFEFATQVDILKEQDVYSSGSVENTIFFLEHISAMPERFHLPLLADFKWDCFFQYSEDKLDVFFDWLTGREPAYKAMLLSENTLMSAVDNPSTIVRLIGVVKTLEIQDQISLLNAFNAVLEVQQGKFNHTYQLEHHEAIQSIKSIAPPAPIKKRSLSFYETDQQTGQDNSESLERPVQFSKL